MNISRQNLLSIIGELLEVFEPEHIYLFGSANKGNFCDDSDIDLAFYTSLPKRRPFLKRRYWETENSFIRIIERNKRSLRCGLLRNMLC